MRKLHFVLVFMLVVGMLIPTTFSYAQNVNESDQIKVKLIKDPKLIEHERENQKDKQGGNIENNQKEKGELPGYLKPTKNTPPNDTSSTTVTGEMESNNDKSNEQETRQPNLIVIERNDNEEKKTKKGGEEGLSHTTNNHSGNDGSKEIIIDLNKKYKVSESDRLIYMAGGIRAISILMPEDLPEGTEVIIARAENADEYELTNGFYVAGEIFDVTITYPKGMTPKGKFLLELSYDNSKYKPHEVDIYYHEDNEWIRQYGDADDVRGMISLEVEHFSEYAVLSKSNQQIQTDKNSLMTLFFIAISMLAIAVIGVAIILFLKKEIK